MNRDTWTSACDSFNSCVQSFWRPACDSGSCVEVRWQAATHTVDGVTENDVRDDPGGRVLVRDGKFGDASPIIAFTPDQWRDTLEQVKTEYPDRALVGPIGVWWIGETDDVILRFTWAEWTEFEDAVTAGRFDIGGPAAEDR